MTPRVAMVATTTSGEPNDLLAARLRTLLDRGWDAHLFCKGERFLQKGALREPRLGDRVELTEGRDRYLPPVSLLRRPTGMLRYLGAQGETGPFDGRLLSLRPDLIHFCSGSAAWKGLRLKELLGCRVMISFRDDGRDLSAPDQERLWRAGDLFVFPSAAVLERAIVLGCPPEKAEVLGQPFWNGDPGAPKGGSKDGSFRILSAGPLIWEQGFEHSVHAVRLLLDMGVSFEYRIVGDGGHLYAVAFARHQLGLADHVHLLPADGGALLLSEAGMADVVVDPAVTDTVSSAMLAAAQGLGVPFVATHRDGLPEDAGFAVPRRDPRAIAESLATLAGDAALRERMGEAGRANPGRYPTLDDHVRRLEEMYRRALA